MVLRGENLGAYQGRGKGEGSHCEKGERLKKNISGGAGRKYDQGGLEVENPPCLTFSGRSLVRNGRNQLGQSPTGGLLGGSVI